VPAPKYFHVLDPEVPHAAEIQRVLGLVEGSGWVGAEDEFDVLQAA